MGEASFWEKRGKNYRMPDEATMRNFKTIPVEHLLAYPEEARQEFFEKYLRHSLKRGMDPFWKAKYQEYAAKIGEVPLGKDFLVRMVSDIKTRRLEKLRRDGIELDS